MSGDRGAVTTADDITGLSDHTREILASVGTATIANVLLGKGFRNRMLLGLHAVTDGAAMVGPAYTLRFIPAREDLDSMAEYSRDDNLHRRAIEECPAGSVLVIDAFGCTTASSMGDMMAARLAYRGVAGVVTDGGFRDAPAIRATGLPCFQRQSAPPATPIGLHPVELDGPVGCAGVAVYPGDIVVGDGDGIVVIPRGLADEVAQAAAAAEAYEEFAAEGIASGRSIFGLFPATDASRREYDRWVAESRPGSE